MTIPIGQPGMTPAAQPPVEKKPVETPQNETKTDFQEKLQTSPANNPQQANATQAANKLESTSQVNNAQKPAGGDMFGRFDAIRSEFETFLKKSEELDKQIASGKLKPDDPKVMSAKREEMRMLLHLQSEMQGSAMKVEIASKVVEHGTSGVKTVLQTQA